MELVPNNSLLPAQDTKYRNRDDTTECYNNHNLEERRAAYHGQNSASLPDVIDKGPLKPLAEVVGRNTKLPHARSSAGIMPLKQINHGEIVVFTCRLYRSLTTVAAWFRVRVGVLLQEKSRNAQIATLGCSL